MVRYFYAVFFLIISPLYSLPTDQVTAEVQWNSIYENTPFTVTVTVTHDQNSTVDLNSFQVKDKKVVVRFIQNVRFSPSSPLILSIYEFEMPGLPRGLQMLPAISALVGGKKVSSVPTGFEVKGEGTSPPFLKLEVLFDGLQPLYPGQKATLGYRYLFNTNIDLSEEVLPLLEAKGFKKVGDKQVQEADEKGTSLRQVTQKVQALDVGDFVFGPSIVSGYAYKLDKAGNKQYQQPALTSTVDKATIKVAPFPTDGKPGSFRGAIGTYTMQVGLLTAPPVHIGDKIQLQIAISGDGDFDTVLAPDLCCQPGFSGYFKTSDLPPAAIIKGNTKTFVVEIIPENSDIAAIPPIEFSSFNPVNKTYGISLSSGMPFQVLGELLPPHPEPSSHVSIALPSPSTPSSFTMTGSFAMPVSLLALVTFGLSWLTFKSHYQARREIVELKDAPPESFQLYQEALLQSSDELFYFLMAKALRRRLLEMGKTTTLDAPLESIPEAPDSLAIKALLEQIEVTRFAKSNQLAKEAVLLQAKELLNA